MTNFLRSWRVFDVITNFLMAWRVFMSWRTLWRHDVLFYIMACFWRHDKICDVITCLWSHVALFHVMTCFWRHDVFLTSLRTFFCQNALFDVTVLTCFGCHDAFFNDGNTVNNHFRANKCILNTSRCFSGKVNNSYDIEYQSEVEAPIPIKNRFWMPKKSGSSSYIKFVKENAKPDFSG